MLPVYVLDPSLRVQPSSGGRGDPPLLGTTRRGGASSRALSHASPVVLGWEVKFTPLLQPSSPRRASSTRGRPTGHDLSAVHDTKGVYRFSGPSPRRGGPEGGGPGARGWSVNPPPPPTPGVSLANTRGPGRGPRGSSRRREASEGRPPCAPYSPGPFVGPRGRAGGPSAASVGSRGGLSSLGSSSSSSLSRRRGSRAPAGAPSYRRLPPRVPPCAGPRRPR